MRRTKAIYENSKCALTEDSMKIFVRHDARNGEAISFIVDIKIQFADGFIARNLSNCVNVLIITFLNFCVLLNCSF